MTLTTLQAVALFTAVALAVLAVAALHDWWVRRQSPWQRAYRAYRKAGRPAILSGYRSFPTQHALHISHSNHMLNGHHRLAAAQAYGFKTVPVQRRPAPWVWDEDEAMLPWPPR